MRGLSSGTLRSLRPTSWRKPGRDESVERDECAERNEHLGSALSNKPLNRSKQMTRHSAYFDLQAFKAPADNFSPVFPLPAQHFQSCSTVSHFLWQKCDKSLTRQVHLARMTPCAPLRVWARTSHI